jgi:hypothetical protein
MRFGVVHEVTPNGYYRAAVRQFDAVRNFKIVF